MANDKTKADWNKRTLAVHGGTTRSSFGETSEAMFLNSGFVYDNAEAAEARFKGDDPGYIYSRYANPTVTMFEERMAALEGAEGAVATASGMAAVSTALLCFLQAGDHVVAARALFGSCLYIIEDILPRFGVTTTLVDGCDLAAWEQAFKPGTKACFFETPSNPCLDIIDIAGVSALAHAVGARVIIDNVFASPVLQSPLALGADVVVYSATKHIDGQGRCLGGIILADEDFLEDHVRPFTKHTGPALSPFNAWVMLKGLETLDLRVREQCRSAAQIADILAETKGIHSVRYPHRPDHPQSNLAGVQMSAGGTLVSFSVDGGQARAFAGLNRLKLIKISNNLGDSKSLITHPTTTTHQRLEEEARVDLGITNGLLRLSVGLEDVGDLASDLEQAFAI